MDLPKPETGLVIRYSYLWHHEQKAGQVEGRKDRPCAIVLVTKSDQVMVVPVTHSEPPTNSTAVKLPQKIKNTLRLDSKTSWVITSEVNTFTWPGYDLRPATDDNWAFGKLPEGVTKYLQERVVFHAKQGKLKRSDRDDG